MLGFTGGLAACSGIGVTKVGKDQEDEVDADLDLPHLLLVITPNFVVEAAKEEADEVAKIEDLAEEVVEGDAEAVAIGEGCVATREEEDRPHAREEEEHVGVLLDGFHSEVVLEERLAVKGDCREMSG